MSSKKPRNPKLTPEMLALIENDAPDCGREFDQNICIMKHRAAKNKEAKGLMHGPCAYCPAVLKFLGRVTKSADKPESPAIEPEITQEEPKTMTEETIQAPKKEKSEKYQKICITPECQNTVKAHGKTGRCHSCQAKVNAKLAHEARKNKKPAPRTDEKKTWNGQANQPGYAIVGAYPEPAADTIHASQPPEKLLIHIEESDVCRRAINQYGILRQMAKAAEEFAEAAAAINRHMATEGSHEEIISELADVEVMCVQMRMILGANAIEQQRAEKVARLNGRLKP